MGFGFTVLDLLWKRSSVLLLPAWAVYLSCIRGGREERRHMTDDVCDLGARRSLVSGDMAGSRLPESTAAKYYLPPLSLTFLSEKQRKSKYREEMEFLWTLLMFMTPQTQSGYTEVC